MGIQIVHSYGTGEEYAIVNNGLGPSDLDSNSVGTDELQIAHIAAWFSIET